jgi:hypothetical protein
MSDEAPREHALLRRTADGSTAIRWGRVIAALVAYAVLMATISIIANRLLGTPMRAGSFALSLLMTSVPWLYLVWTAKRQAEGRSARQFSLLAALCFISLLCVVIALLAADRRADLAVHSERELLQQQLVEIVGQGDVHVSTQTLIQVKRTAFDDADLAKILALNDKLQSARAPLYFLSLANTQVTDRGVAQLAQVESLQYCFLDGAKVTDQAIDSLRKLPELKLLSTWSTKVTDEALLRLSRERPTIDLEPKTYQRKAKASPTGS